MPKRSLSVATDDPRYVECDDCGSTLMRSNLSRHRMTHVFSSNRRPRSASEALSATVRVGRRGDIDAEDHRSVYGSNGSISSQRSCPTANGSREEVGVLFSNSSSFSFSEYLVASAAASTVVEQHDRYDLDGLCTFIAANFPTIPADARPYLVIGAAAGAQHAAQIHFLAETHEASRESGKQEIASRAKCSLSSWIIGLRRGNEFFRPVGDPASSHTLHGTANRNVPIEEVHMDVIDPAANIVESSSLQTDLSLKRSHFLCLRSCPMRHWMRPLPPSRGNSENRK
jgi:hypothetical protein